VDVTLLKSDLSTPMYFHCFSAQGTESALLVSVDSDIQTLQRDGIVAHKGAFAREFVEQMREDMMTSEQQLRLPSWRQFL
jgi:hypothetical protein